MPLARLETRDPRRPRPPLRIWAAAEPDRTLPMPPRPAHGGFDAQDLLFVAVNEGAARLPAGAIPDLFAEATA